MLGSASTLNLVEEALRLIVVEELTKRARSSQSALSLL
jgi:hypothetical protein